MAERCGTSSTLTIDQQDPDCGCTAKEVARLTPIFTSGAPSVAPGECDPNIAYDVTGEVLYFYYNGSWHPFGAITSIPALNLCSLQDAAAIVVGDTVAGCFQGATADVTVDELKDYILDLCGLTDLSASVSSGNTQLAACVAGNTGLIDPNRVICVAPNRGDLADGDEIVVCDSGEVARKTYVEPCLAPEGNPIQDGDTLIACGPGGLERREYVDPDPCSSPVTSSLAVGDSILVCGTGGLERKPYAPSDVCAAPDGGDLLGTDEIVVCRGDDIVKVNTLPWDGSEPCSTRIRHEDNDPLIEVVEETSCGDCCGFVIRSIGTLNDICAQVAALPQPAERIGG